MVSKVWLVAGAAAVAAGAGAVVWRARRKHAHGSVDGEQSGGVLEATASKDQTLPEPVWRKPVDKAASGLRESTSASASPAVSR